MSIYVISGLVIVYDGSTMGLRWIYDGDRHVTLLLESGTIRDRSNQRPLGVGSGFFLNRLFQFCNACALRTFIGITFGDVPGNRQRAQNVSLWIMHHAKTQIDI